MNDLLIGNDRPVNGRVSSVASSVDLAKAGEGYTVWIKGFDVHQAEVKIKRALEAGFKQFGSVKAIRLPMDRDNGGLRGIAYIDFNEPVAEVINLSLDHNEILFIILSSINCAFLIATLISCSTSPEVLYYQCLIISILAYIQNTVIELYTSNHPWAR